MRDFGFWKPVIVSLMVTPVALFMGLVSAGAGHGNYVWAKILFPYTMLSTLLFGSITTAFIVLAVAQFPLYGVGLGIANKNHKIIPAAVALLAIHIMASMLFFLFGGENFR